MLEYYNIDIRSSNTVITVAKCKFSKISNTLMYSCLFFNAEVQNGNINFSALTTLSCALTSAALKSKSGNVKGESSCKRVDGNLFTYATGKESFS